MIAFGAHECPLSINLPLLASPRTAQSSRILTSTFVGYLAPDDSSFMTGAAMLVARGASITRT